MPRIPTYDSFQTAQAELPGVRQDTPKHVNTGALFAAHQMQQMGGAIQQAAQEYQATQNEAAVKDADAQFTAGVTAILHDKNTGYLNQSGANAVAKGEDGMTPDARASKAISDLRAKMLEGLKDPRQQQMFKQASDMRINSANAQVMEHAAQQTKVYELNSSASRARAAGDAATLGYNPMLPPESQGTDYQNSIKIQRIELEHQADQRGITDPAMRKEYIDNGADGKSGMLSTYQGIMSHLLANGQPKAAKAYLDSVRGDLPPDLADKMGKDINTIGVKDDALKLSMSLTGGLDAQRKKLDEMYRNGEISADVHDGAMQRVEHNDAVRKSQQAEYEKNLVGGAQDWIIKNPGKSVQDMPPSMYLGLKNSGHLATMVGFANSFKEGAASQDDPALFMSLHGKANDGQLTMMDVLGARGKVSNAHFEDLMRTYNAIDKKDSAQIQIDKTINTAMHTANVASDIKASGLNSSAKPDTQQAKDYAAFQATVRDKLVQAFQNNPKLTQDDANNIVRGMVKDQVLSGGGWFGMDKKQPLYKFKAGELPTVKDDAGYAALPKGARFIGPDGKTRVKP